MTDTVEFYKDQGNNAFRNDNYQEAYENYTKALEKEPDNALVLSNRSVTLSKLEKYPEALKDAERVLELKPNWGKAYLRLGTAQYNNGKKEDALKTLGKGMTVDPDDETIQRYYIMIDHALKREKGEEVVETTQQPSRSNYQSSWYREEPKTETKRELITKSGLTLQVCSGDITKETVDAIVNAANNSLMLGGGVAGAIDRAGGSVIQEECDVWTDLFGRVSDGQCGLTSGGNMPCKWVIHAVGPVWSDGHKNEDQDLLYSVYNSLIMANDLKCESISFPGISSGIFGFPKERCAKIMFHAVFQYIKNFSNQSLKVIRFTNYDQPTWSVFVEEFDSIFGGKTKVVEDDNIVLKVQDESDQ